MSDEMPEIAYLGKPVMCSPTSGFSGSYYTNSIFMGRELTPYISQASSNQAVRDALDEVQISLTDIADSFLDSKGSIESVISLEDVIEAINNLKSKYEGE